MKRSGRAGFISDENEKEDIGIGIFKYADKYGQSNLYLEIARPK
jgi:hypothetical protein